MDRRTTLANLPDDALDELLTVALKAPEPPVDLADRIVQATRHELERPPSVIARIFGPRVRMAAAVVLGLGIGAWLYTQQLVPDTTTALPPSVATIEGRLMRLAEQTATSDAAIDRQIDMLEMQLVMVQTSGTWPTAEESVDSEILLSELDTMAGESAWTF